MEWQREQLGTGHAAMAAHAYLQHFHGDVLVLYGDVPGIRPETLQQLCKVHGEHQNSVTILTAEIASPGKYGRIIKDNQDCPEHYERERIYRGI